MCNTGSRINPFPHARVAARCASPSFAKEVHARNSRITYARKTRGCQLVVCAPWYSGTCLGREYLCSRYVHKEHRLLVARDPLFYDDLWNGRRRAPDAYTHARVRARVYVRPRNFHLAVPPTGNDPSTFGITSEPATRLISVTEA